MRVTRNRAAATEVCFRSTGISVKEREKKKVRPDLNQVPADLQSAALTTELCPQTRCEVHKESNVGATKGASAKMENCDDNNPNLVDQVCFSSYPDLLGGHFNQIAQIITRLPYEKLSKFF